MPTEEHTPDTTHAQEARETITRKDAISRGMNRYFTGKPCHRGHVAERKVHSWACCECARVDTNLKRHPELCGEAPPRREHNHTKVRRRTDAQIKAGRIANSNWARNNPEKNTAKANRRRAIKAGSEGTYSKDDVIQIAIMQEWLCGNHRCRASFDKVKMTVDHIVPISKGGSNWPTNLQMLCKACNSSKGTKLPEHWA